MTAVRKAITIFACPAMTSASCIYGERFDRMAAINHTFSKDPARFSIYSLKKISCVLARFDIIFRLLEE